MSKIIAFLLLVVCAIPVYADDNGCGAPGEGNTCESGCYFVPGNDLISPFCAPCNNGPDENGDNDPDIGCDDNNNCHYTGSGTENDPNSCPWEQTKEKTESKECTGNSYYDNACQQCSDYSLAWVSGGDFGNYGCHLTTSEYTKTTTTTTTFDGSDQTSTSDSVETLTLTCAGQEQEKINLPNNEITQSCQPITYHLTFDYGDLHCAPRQTDMWIRVNNANIIKYSTNANAEPNQNLSNIHRPNCYPKFNGFYYNGTEIFDRDGNLKRSDLLNVLKTTGNTNITLTASSDNNTPSTYNLQINVKIGDSEQSSNYIPCQINPNTTCDAPFDKLKNIDFNGRYWDKDSMQEYNMIVVNDNNEYRGYISYNKTADTLTYHYENASSTDSDNISKLLVETYESNPLTIFVANASNQETDTYNNLTDLDYNTNGSSGTEYYMPICSAGSFCYDMEKIKCPYGISSDVGTTAPANCYITSDTPLYQNGDKATSLSSLGLSDSSVKLRLSNDQLKTWCSTDSRKNKPYCTSYQN